MRSTYPTLVLIAATLSTVACGSERRADPDAAAALPIETDPAPVADSETFTETSVWIDVDGETHSATRPITAGEERAQNAARARHVAGGPGLLIAQDSACTGSSLWLYSRSDWTGDLICFAGRGAGRLSDYPRTLCSVGAGGTICTQWSWVLSQGSLWAGEASGGLWTGSSPFFPIDGGAEQTITFDAWEHKAFSVTPQLLTHVSLDH